MWRCLILYLLLVPSDAGAERLPPAAGAPLRTLASSGVTVRPSTSYQAGIHFICSLKLHCLSHIPHHAFKRVY